MDVCLGERLALFLVIRAIRVRPGRICLRGVLEPSCFALDVGAFTLPRPRSA